MKLLSLDEASKICGVCTITMRKHIREGKLRACRLGKLWKIDELDLLKFIKNEQKATREILLSERRKNGPVDLPGQSHFEGCEK